MQIGVGEWVKYRGSARVGIVTNKRNEEINLCVKWHWENGKMLTNMSIGWYSEAALLPAPLELNQDNYRAMIDLALDTKDHVWFNELVGDRKND